MAPEAYTDLLAHAEQHCDREEEPTVSERFMKTLIERGANLGRPFLPLRVPGRSNLNVNQSIDSMHDIIFGRGNAASTETQPEFQSNTINRVNILRELLESELTKEEFHERHFRTSYSGNGSYTQIIWYTKASVWPVL